MLTIFIAKFIADRFKGSISIYDIHIELKCVPFIDHKPSLHNKFLYACDIMNEPV